MTLRFDGYLRERADVAGPEECWPWKLSVGSHGYGNAFNGTTVVLAHRLAYETWVGPIPGGLTVDHKCHVRRCINPTHLRVLSNVENARDNGQVTKTHCPSGHPYDGANLYVNPLGHRHCRTCARRAKRASGGKFQCDCGEFFATQRGLSVHLGRSCRAA